MTCPGDQDCWEECECECIDDDGYPWETCECGHRAHQTVENGMDPAAFKNGVCQELGGAFCPDTWCGNPACKLTLCMMCGTGSKTWMTDPHGGLCSAICAMTMGAGGPVNRAGVGECPVCLETVRLVKLGQCSHEMCYACRAKQLHAKATIEDGMDQFASCPMCRAPNNQAIDPENPFEHLREAARAQWELRENRDLPEGSFAE